MKYLKLIVFLFIGYSYAEENNKIYTMEEIYKNENLYKRISKNCKNKIEIEINCKNLEKATVEKILDQRIKKYTKENIKNIKQLKGKN